MGQALYRKYRSKKLSEIVGQDHITHTLENAIKTGKVSHAYLFTGPKGVGKTSVARILAHKINNLPYEDESLNIDIIEIDAASNRRIDEIRDLRDKVLIAPTSSKYKIYIIDEVHMLTKEAFNALLKTLEEPPEHVIFILATTEINKLPETIISRTQRFTFKPIDNDQAILHLRDIAEKEGMTIDGEALNLIVAHSLGSFRDSINLLDQVGNSKKNINVSDAENLLGIASNDQILNILEEINNGTASGLMKQLNNVIVDGISPAQIAKQLALLLRTALMNDQDKSTYIELLENLLSVQSSPEPSGQLEITLLKAQANSNLVNTTKINNEIVPTEVKDKTVKIEVQKPITTVSKPNYQNNSLEWWGELLLRIKEFNNTLYGVLRMANPEINDMELVLRFKFGFHKKKIDDATTKTKIRDAIKEITGVSYSIKTEVDKNIVITEKEAIIEEDPVATNNTELSNITNIFGGGEVLEN